MTSRERIIKAIHHIETDEIPVDIGATSATGINVDALYPLYDALGLPSRSPIISDTMQLLSQLEDDVRQALHTDIVPLPSPKTKIGTWASGRNVPFQTPCGTPAQIDDTVKYVIDKASGNYYLYPQGDTTAPYSMVMTSDGSFFNALERCEVDEESETPREDFAELGGIWDDKTALHYEKVSKDLYENTEYAIACAFGGGGFGDLAKAPGPTIAHPKGIRTVESFIEAHFLYPEYIAEVFDMQCQAALKNLEILKQAVGDRIQVICVGGTDFGTQTGLYYSLDTYRTLYKPYIKKLNDYIHANTNWKTFYHSCGAVSELMGDFIDAGVDIINPVQCSATGMDPQKLKDTYGERIVFWGGGVDTQHTFPFGTPEEVKAEVESRIEIFRKGGGFVFSSIHNIVSQTPVANIKAMLEVIERYR